MIIQQRNTWLMGIAVILLLVMTCRDGQAAKIIGSAKNAHGDVVAQLDRDIADPSDAGTTQQTRGAMDSTADGNQDDLTFSHDQRVILNHIRNYNSALSVQTSRYMSDCIVKSCSKYAVDSLLLTAMLTQESGFNPEAYSSSGAMGVGQLMPGTAASLGVVNPWDIGQNIDGAACYFGYQLRRFQNAGEWQLTYAVAAYNAGPGAIIAYDGVPPYRETINYVYRIAAIYDQLVADAG